MIEELAARVFCVRNESHKAHWATKYYAAHMALGDFYDGVIDKIDAVVEAYQGINGLIGNLEEYEDYDSDIVRHIRQTADWINENKDDIAKNNGTVINLIEDLLSVFYTALYKLENLV